MKRKLIILILSIPAFWLVSTPIRPKFATIMGDATDQLEVEIQDQATGEPVSARLYLVDDKGTRWTPPGAISYDKNQEHHFIASGSFTINLSPGKYTLTAERGPEYRSWTSSIEIRPGQSRKEQIRFSRWIHMNSLGWYSGDLHNHRKAEEMSRLLLAEDLNLAPTLTDWIWEDKPVSLPPSTLEAIRQVNATHVYSLLDKEVERLNYGPGAVDLLGLKTAISFHGDRLFPPNDRFCKLAHEQGGYVDAEKIVWRDVCALVALDQIDFAGIVHNHFNRHGVDLETEPWGMIPKSRPEYNTIAGMPPLEYGRVLSILELRVLPACFCRKRFGRKGSTSGLQPRLRRLARCIQLSQLVSRAQSRAKLCNQRSDVVPESQSRRAREHFEFAQYKTRPSQHSRRGLFCRRLGPSRGALQRSGYQGRERP
jgi:hypothetical protein